MVAGLGEGGGGRGWTRRGRGEERKGDVKVIKRLR